MCQTNGLTCEIFPYKYVNSYFVEECIMCVEQKWVEKMAINVLLASFCSCWTTGLKLSLIWRVKPQKMSGVEDNKLCFSLQLAFHVKSAWDRYSFWRINYLCSEREYKLCQNIGNNGAYIFIVLFIDLFFYISTYKIIIFTFVYFNEINQRKSSNRFIVWLIVVFYKKLFYDGYKI